MTSELRSHPDSGLRAERVAGWRTRLAGSRSLSSRYQDRYAIVLAQLAEQATTAVVDEARGAVADDDAGRAAAILAGVVQPPRRSEPSVRSPSVRGSGSVAAIARELVIRHDDVTGFVRSCRHLEQTGVPLHPSREAHLLLADDRELVALRWPAGSVSIRATNQRRMAPLLGVASTVAPLPVVVHDD